MERTRAPILAVASNKGGVGKTTVAANLALYVRALAEDLPVLVVGLDDQRTLDRTFALRALSSDEPGIEEAWDAGTLNHSIRLGQYGIHFVPSPRDGKKFKASVHEPGELAKRLERTGWKGLTLLDTKSDLEILTENALVAADRVIVPVSDRAALCEAERLLARMEALGVSSRKAKLLVTLADRRTRVAANGVDVLALLQHEIDRRGLARYRAFLSRSPTVEALLSADDRPQTILHAARGTALHKQMTALAREVIDDLDLEASASGRVAKPAPEASGSPTANSLAARSATAPGGDPSPEAAPPESTRRWKRLMLGTRAR